MAPTAANCRRPPCLPGSAADLLGLGDNPFETAADALDDVLAALSTGQGLQGRLDEVFNKAQVLELVRGLLSEAATHPKLLEASAELQNIVASLTHVITSENGKLLTHARWQQLAVLTLREAAQNPGRLFGLTIDRPEREIASVLLSSLLDQAATDIDAGHRAGGVLFGDTLFEALRFSVSIIASNPDAAFRLLGLDNAGDRNLVADLISQVSQAVTPSADGPSAAALTGEIHALQQDLANDARKDFKAAKARRAKLKDASRIAFLLNSARKNRHAGQFADKSTMDGVAAKRITLCTAKPGTSLRERDCQLIALLPIITAMQASRDVIFDISITAALAPGSGSGQAGSTGLTFTTDRLGLLAKSMTDLANSANALNNKAESLGLRPDEAKLVATVQFDRWCTAVTAMLLMETATDSLTLAQFEATNLAADKPNAPGAASTELREILETAGVGVAGFAGSYARYSGFMKTKYSLISQTKFYSRHAPICGISTAGRVRLPKP